MSVSIKYDLASSLRLGFLNGGTICEKDTCRWDVLVDDTYFMLKSATRVLRAEKIRCFQILHKTRLKYTCTL